MPWVEELDVRLSAIQIDDDKDWKGKRIKNLGAPAEANDALRKSELDAHAAETETHGAPSGGRLLHTGDLGMQDDKVPTLPAAEEGQVLMRGESEWVAGKKIRSLIASDESEVSETSAEYVTKKELNLVKYSPLELDWKKLIYVAEIRSETAGDTTTLGVFVGGVEKSTKSTTSGSYVLVGDEIDVSDLPDGLTSVEFKLKVSAGTGYLRTVEVWVE